MYQFMPNAGNSMFTINSLAIRESIAPMLNTQSRLQANRETMWICCYFSAKYPLTALKQTVDSHKRNTEAGS